METTETLTLSNIDKVVTLWAEGIATAIKENPADRNKLNSAIYQAVDSGWTELGMPAGRLEHWGFNPETEVLQNLGVILDYCEQEGWIEDDSGLWEGLSGAATMGSQAFFSLRNVLVQKLQDMNVYLGLIPRAGSTLQGAGD